MSVKLFHDYMDRILDAKTEEERIIIFNQADLDFQHEKISYEDSERLCKLVNKLNLG